MKRFCYRCGALEADAGPLVKGLCQRCFVEQSRLLQAPKEVEVVVCKRCGAYMIGKRWYTPAPGDPIKNAIRETIMNSIRVARLTASGTQSLRPQEAREVEIAIEPNLMEGMVKVMARGKVHELQAQPKLEEANIKLNLNYKTCEVCSLKRARYHEAILQVRDELGGEKLFQVRRALEALALEAGERERGDFIAKVEERRKGLDLYVSSAALARRMASLLRDGFGASIHESAKLVGQTRNGRRKFKVSILARISGKVNFKREKSNL